MSATIDTSQNDSDDFEDGGGTGLAIFWFLLLAFMLMLPFCRNSRQRKLCRQRIRERRWIHDSGELDEDDWYVQVYRRRQAERRRRMQAEHERFQTTKTQEDEIREQYLLFLMDKRSKLLSKEDIHTSPSKQDKSAGSHSQKSLGSMESDVENPDIPDIEPKMKRAALASEVSTPAPAPAPASSPAQPPTSTESNSVSMKYRVDMQDRDVESKSGNEDIKGNRTEELLQEMNFFDTDEIICLPLAGDLMVDDDDDDDKGEREGNDYTDSGAMTNRNRKRQVPSGCAICLTAFQVDEKVTWASNRNCRHVFHQDCLLHWFHEVGRKYRKKPQLLPDGYIEQQQQQQRQRQRQTTTTTTTTPMNEDEVALFVICNFPKQCPCCRQLFCIDETSQE